MFEGAARAMKDHLLYRPMTKGAEDVLVAGDVVVESEEDGGTRLDPRNQHLACFAGGMFAIAGRMFERQEDVDVGRRLTEGCLWAYETSPNGIMPEIMHTVPCEDSSNCSWDEQKWLEAVKKGNSEEDGEVDGRSITNERHLREGVSRIEDARYILR
ncbi:Glycoside hydrolase family 47 [Macrophomina phaseolina MS6]|uniref:Glycoside hydrolase family 47 n=1 Tax=Macrophomina phaseolina (strain MS6) TaxID=1126212 RepID=K2SUT6_MACPH|nr:Glycoside hydrolase family 47 [Macrophomina phaseolina MS6]